MPLLKQSPMTNSPQSQEVTDAVKVLGWFWELVNPNCHQCWQGPCHADTVSTPAGTKLSMPNQSVPVISEKYFIRTASCSLITASEYDGGGEWFAPHMLFGVWHWLSSKCYSVLTLSVQFFYCFGTTPTHCIWNETMTMRLKLLTFSFKDFRVFTSILGDECNTQSFYTWSSCF